MICPEAQGPSSAFHYSVRIEATENASFIIFGRVEVGDHDVVSVDEVHIAGRANRALPFSLARKLKLVRAIDAEDMANALLV